MIDILQMTFLKSQQVTKRKNMAEFEIALPIALDVMVMNDN